MGSPNSDLGCSSKLLLFIIILLVVPIIHTLGQTTASLFMAASDGQSVTDLTVEQGESISITCFVVLEDANQIVSMTRETENFGEETLLWNKNVTTSANTEHFEYDGFVDIGGNNFVYVMLVHNVTRYDVGTYSCKVFNQFGNTPVASGDSDLRILHLPGAIYPICTIISADKSLSRFANDEVTFRCESEDGDPEVFLDWTLSSRGPEIPTATEYGENGLVYSEIVVGLKESHTGKQFECTMTSGFDLSYHPKCTIGPFNVQSRPTTPPKPMKTPTPKASTLPISNVRVSGSTQTSHTSMQTMLPSDGTSSEGLTKAAVAAICVVIALAIGMVIIIVIACLIKTDRFSLESKNPHSNKQGTGFGIVTIGTSLRNSSNEGPKLLGFKRRVSKKASLKSESDSEMSEEHSFENGRLVLDFDTITEGEESPSLSNCSSHRPVPATNVPPPPPAYESVIDPVTPISPTSPQSDQPFLQPTQSNEGFTTPPASPAMQTEEHPEPEESDDLPAPPPLVTPTPPLVTPTPHPPITPAPEETTPSLPDHHAEYPSSPVSSVFSEDNMIEGEFVTDSEETLYDHIHVEEGTDPSAPQNLPQDVMDILMELDLDLFANEETEDTSL